ncbi:septal ring lytic transglycosylase RlpA family protein [Algoriphagus sp. CAU 1675]|uniref:septal ring lytic transglycosylase RlpA family protein n=1 Tax=Algoriphagus sp. CAU 1675 TaxID=3032597 RepID=UPI0023DC07DF|nr:septal ring lytic transglycosylase RlpA family protein [Algoriphagus sp. CAU 1675]MDF2158659.1 septal ring lytic transglycosylase RlpA family protein [Algoriphagus sp. CAU 1675]
MRLVFLVLLVVVLGFSTKGQQLDSLKVQEGWASFYGKRFHLRKTANGEIFHMDSLTAAHKYLPFDTWLKVTRLDTGDSVWVRINDRLPKSSRRIIDLSRRAASELGMIQEGISQVTLKVASIEEMNRLYRQFEGDAPGTLRVRWFEEPIQIPYRPRQWCWSLEC